MSLPPDEASHATLIRAQGRGDGFALHECRRSSFGRLSPSWSIGVAPWRSPMTPALQRVCAALGGGDRSRRERSFSLKNPFLASAPADVTPGVTLAATSLAAERSSCMAGPRRLGVAVPG